ncbi:hypothetical protein GGR57DRAFT_332857 [Xylariaceae sp. FL1272]|nr:hypothetical protein GGR57DRAFT_332857 [Xylariaceae sp. FL1272]
MDCAITVHDQLSPKTLAELSVSAGLWQTVSDANGEHEHKSTDGLHETTNAGLSLSQDFFLALDPRGSVLQTQSQTLRTRRHVDFISFQKALKCLVQTHSMLRARFACREDGTWAQSIFESEIQKTFYYGHYMVEFKDDASSIVEAGRMAINIINGLVFSADLIYISGDG